MSEQSQLAVAEVQPPQQIITIEPEKYVALVFEPFRTKLDKLKGEASNVTYDITTTAGMKTAIEWRAKFRDEVRLPTEAARKLRKAPILEIGKLLDSRAKEIVEEAEPFESRFDADIKAEEARKEAEKQAKLVAEKARVDAIRAKIDVIRATPAKWIGKPSADIGVAADHLSETIISLDEYAEFAGEAQVERDHAVKQMREMQAAQLAHEQEQARIKDEREELARLRAEAEERERKAAEERAEQERKDRAERARVEAEHRAAQERAAEAMRRQQAEHEARMAAERTAAEVELRRQREAEEARLAEQRAEIARQQAEIAAAKAEQERIEREAREAAEAEERRKREETEAAARAETERTEAERRAAEQEQIRREREQFAINGPGDVEIVKCLAYHYGVTVGDAMQWMKKFDYAATDEYFAAANVAAKSLEKAA